MWRSKRGFSVLEMLLLVGVRTFGLLAQLVALLHVTHHCQEHTGWKGVGLYEWCCPHCISSGGSFWSVFVVFLSLHSAEFLGYTMKLWPDARQASVIWLEL